VESNICSIVLTLSRLLSTQGTPSNNCSTGSTGRTHQEAKPSERGQRRLSANRARELVQAYQAGASIQQLVEHYGIHEKAVRVHLARAGVTLRPVSRAKLSAADERILCRLYRDGWSLRRLSERFHVTGNTVVKTLHHHEMQTRQPGRPRER
jgi:DNA-directed RNA polymerase specialized sigma24 family protein